MTEDFMTWVWYHVLSRTTGLRTTDGTLIQVISAGTINTDSGPDIFNARLYINGMLWAGNVEMHLKATGWNEHGHQDDPSYDNVILHVVIYHDADVFIGNRKVPVLIIPVSIVNSCWSKYQELTSSLDLVACQEYISGLSPMQKNSWIDLMLKERMESSLSAVDGLVRKGITLPAEIFFHLLTKNMGFRVNSDPFSILAMQIPYQILVRTSGSRSQTEALLFGISGLLPEHHKEPYVSDLNQEFVHLQRKFGIRRMDPRIWKFMRMRPNNFPTIRISQLAGLIGRIDDLVANVIHQEEVTQLREMLEVKASPFWDTHYTFNERSRSSPKVLGKGSTENVLINTVAVFSHWYGRCTGDRAGTDHAMRILKTCKPESNKFIRRWKQVGLNVSDASETQALYHLITRYCSHKKCLNCAWSAGLLHKLY